MDNFLISGSAEYSLGYCIALSQFIRTRNTSRTLKLESLTNNYTTERIVGPLDYYQLVLVREWNRSNYAIQHRAVSLLHNITSQQMRRCTAAESYGYASVAGKGVVTVGE
jgi:hypothetical protein